MIKLIKPYISFDEVEEEFREVFESGWFTKGRFVEEFTKEIKGYTNAKYAFLTTSATTALTMALKALGIKEGDEVIVSDFSFPATANVVEDLGAVPVFVDVSLDTFNMLADALERAITNKTKAVIFVDALGNPSGIHTIKAVCKEYNLPLIEDAACAIGSSEFGVKCGNISDISCFSLHPRKLLTTGEGGIITCNNKEYANFFNVKLNHGAVVTNAKLDFIDYGYNYRLSELQAVMGIKQFQKLDTIVQNRNKSRERLKKLIEPLGFRAQKTSDGVTFNVQSLTFITPKGISRDKLIEALRKKEIESTIGTYALSATSYYRKKYNNIQNNSLFLENNTITLPCFDGVDIDYIAKSIEESLCFCKE